MPTPTYTALSTITLTGSDSEILFGSIPGTYRDLVVVIQGASATATNWRVRFNGDAGTNYHVQIMAGTGSGTAANSYPNEVFGGFVWQGYSGVTSLSQATLNVMDYSATDKQKTFLAQTDTPSAATEYFVNRWANTAAITSMSFFPQNTTWNTGTTISLYGVAA